MFQKRNNMESNDSSHQEGMSHVSNLIFVKTERLSNEDKCRVCLDKGIIPIYGAASSIGESISLIGGIKVDESIGFPRYLCEKCHSLLRSAMRFRKMAQHTDQMLKKTYYLNFGLNKQHKESEDFFSDDFNFDLQPREAQLNYSNLTSHQSQRCSYRQSESKDKSLLQCEVCQKQLPKCYYRKHMAVHGIIKCDICKKNIRKISYDRHMRVVHKKAHLKYICEVCGKELSNKYSYKTHTLTHSSVFPYKCQFCPYKGRHAALLKTHMRTHTKDYRYQCTECPKSFLTNSNFHRHLRTHKVGEYKCETCNKAFHTQTKLEKHCQVDHLGIKNHVCNICGKDFGYRHRMMKHQLKVHKREKLQSGRMPSYLQAEKLKLQEQTGEN